MSDRTAAIKRTTGETDIDVKLNLDGTGEAKIDTGIGFFDHMLFELAKHSFTDMEVTVKGDLEVDDHHSVEDAGIAIGQALLAAIGDKKGIRRYGSAVIPMDECLALVAIDLCGRPYFSFDVTFPTEMVGSMHTEMVKEFFYAVSYSCPMNLHIRLLSGENSHHICEVIFKAFAKALDAATQIDPRITGVLSTKGKL